jgi:hypothetical protein
MPFAREIGHWFAVTAQPLYYWMAAAGVLVAARTYRKNSVLERARWLANLYSKFYEAPDLKNIRRTLDECPPNDPEIQKIVADEREDFTDYLNFFEFMAYLRHRSQLSERDVAALFDYYLRNLSKHESVRKYVEKDRNGFGFLKELLQHFPLEESR